MTRLSPTERSSNGRRLTLAALRELWPLLVIAAAVSFILRNVAATNWRDIFLYNGDSITLPLVVQSLQRGEPFEWVFSTQTFLFPEFPIYWLCSLVAHSPQSALLLNAFVNVFLLYGLLRAIVAMFAPRRPIRQIVIALGAVMVLLAAIVSERSTFIMYPGVVAPSNIPTLFLLTTYYYGVILLGVAAVAFTISITRGFARDSLTRGRVIVCAALLVPVGAVTTYSNPLYAAMVLLPLLVVLTILFVLRRLGWRWFVVLAGSHLVAIGIGMLARKVFWRFIAASDFSGYLHPDQAWNALLQVLTVLRDWSVPGWGWVRLLALFVPLVCTAAYLVVAGVRKARGHAPIQTSRLFVLLFVLVGAASLVTGQVLTGQHLTRYLVPLFVFPLMGLIVVLVAISEHPWFERVSIPLRRGLTIGVAGVGVVASVLVGAYSVPAVVAMGQDPFPGARCLDAWLDGRDINGVATFMTARPLELYGDHEGRVVQTVHTVEPNGWMTNLWYFKDTEFSFVLTTNESEFESATEHLGRPAEITACPNFDILDYAGTDGAEVLNDDLQRYLVHTVGGREY